MNAVFRHVQRSAVEIVELVMPDSLELCCEIERTLFTAPDADHTCDWRTSDLYKANE